MKFPAYLHLFGPLFPKFDSSNCARGCQCKHGRESELEIFGFFENMGHLFNKKKKKI